MTEASDGRRQRPARPSPHSFTARHGALSLWALLLAPACQVAFGDFKIDTSRLVVSCQPNSTRCYASKIQRCLGGSEWTDVGPPCPSADLCNLAALACTPCQPGEYQCSETQLQLCGDDLKWKVSATCASAALCSVTADRRSGACAEPGCPLPGQHRCSGNRLQRCALDQSRWDDVELCASASLCDAAAADLQVGAGDYATCRLPACNAGQFNCETGSPRPCNAERTGWAEAVMDCTAGPSCNVATGDCSPCVAGAAHCSGPTLQLCNAQLAFTPSQTCHSTAACSAERSTCGVVTCNPGEFRCVEPAQLQRCRSDGVEWVLAEQCSSTPLCNPKATRCEPPACRSGSARCEGNARQRCRENLTGWDTDPACPAGQMCDPALGCVPGSACSEGQTRCNDVSAERCAGGVWVEQGRCLTRELCQPDTGNCALPMCDVGERRCTGKDVEICDVGRHEFRLFDTCLGTEVCNNETRTCEEQ
ncbi:MAG TPA: hypothetical protein VER33_02360 [Polyangiaceae bacterium]|nr:hypothetical protein [Polyangiaceae bacterium]